MSDCRPPTLFVQFSMYCVGVINFKSDEKCSSFWNTVVCQLRPFALIGLDHVSCVPN